MNFDITEMEYFPIPKISHLNSYDTKIIEGIKDEEVYKTSIMIQIDYCDSDMTNCTKEVSLPFELNLGDKELIELKLNNVDIQVIDNQGINIEYFIYVEVSEVSVAFEQDNLFNEEIMTLDEKEDVTIIEAKEQITSSYEEILENTGIREELPVKYIDSECPVSNLKDDFMNIKVLFNINVDDVDKIAFKYNLSVDNCFKKITQDKTRLII